jgi:hypothetical protein
MIGPDIRNVRIIHLVEFPSNISAPQFLLLTTGGHIDEYIRIIA